MPHAQFCGDAYEHTEMCSAVKAARACVSAETSSYLLVLHFHGPGGLTQSCSHMAIQWHAASLCPPDLYVACRLGGAALVAMDSHQSVGTRGTQVVIAIVAASVAGLSIFFTGPFLPGFLRLLHAPCPPPPGPLLPVMDVLFNIELLLSVLVLLYASMPPSPLAL